MDLFGSQIQGDLIGVAQWRFYQGVAKEFGSAASDSFPTLATDNGLVDLILCQMIESLQQVSDRMFKTSPESLGGLRSNE